jgi:hypothetical protein
LQSNIGHQGLSDVKQATVFNLVEAYIKVMQGAVVFQMLAKGLHANTGNFVVAAVKYDEGLPEFIVLSECFAESYS